MLESPHKGKTGVRRLLNALGYSAAGLREAFRNEDAFRQEVLLACVLVPAAFWLESEAWPRAVLVACVLLVLIVELLNSAVEAVVDRVSFERHELSKRAKDIASAAVLMSLLLAGGIWGAALWQHLR